MLGDIRRRALPIMVGSALLVTTVACDATEDDDVNGAGAELPGVDTPVAGPVIDYETLITALRTDGFTVEPTGDVSQPFLSVDGQTIEVDGETIQVYTYPNPEAAADTAQQFSPDASTFDTTMITWIDEPHIYQAGRLLVIYVGSDDQVLNALESALGGQVAGAGAVRVAIEPPAGTLSVDGESQTAMIGSYCWETVCVDAGTMEALGEALSVEHGETATFDFGDDLAPASATSTAYLIPDDATTQDGRVTLDQSLPEGQSIDAAITDGEIVIGTDDLAPGEYVLSIFVDVPEGDATYNFHVVIE